MPAPYPPEQHRYVYAVVPASVVGERTPCGIEGRPVAAVIHRSLAAWTSPVSTDRIRPSRANLAAHQDVVSWAHDRGPVLPVRFGTVMPNEEAVVDEMLDPGGRRFESMLALFDGKDEFRIKCRYRADVALREVVERNPKVRRLRERVRAAGPAARPRDQLHLGELVVAELERMRGRDAGAVMELIRPHILGWEPVDDPSDDVPLHAAVIVDRRVAPQLEAALGKLAEHQSGRLEVELIGPLPMWDFSQVPVGAV